MSSMRFALLAVAVSTPSLARAQNCSFASGGWCMAEFRGSVPHVEPQASVEAAPPSALVEDRFAERVVQRGPSEVDARDAAPRSAPAWSPTPTPSPPGDPEAARRGHPCPYSGFADPS